MTSQSQIDANRANAQSSTGPRTNPGKERSSKNSIRHGLQSEKYVLPGEDTEAFEHLVDELFLDVQPVGERERELTRAIALAYWQLQRLAAVEASLFTFRIGEQRVRDTQEQLIVANSKHGNKRRDNRNRSADDPREIAARNHAEATAALRGKAVLLGRSFLTDAAGPDGFSKLGRYAGGILSKVTKLSQELERLQAARLGPVDGNDD